MQVWWIYWIKGLRYRVNKMMGADRQSDRQTDGQTQVTTITLRSKRPSVKKKLKQAMTLIFPYDCEETNNNHKKTAKVWSKQDMGSYEFLIRSRRNPRSRCAWLTGPEPRWGYARTSFGVDAAAEVTISKCNLWKSWTLELTSEFSHAHLTIFSTVWDAGWFYQDHASRVNAKPQKTYQYFVA